MTSVRSALSPLLYFCSGWVLCWVFVVTPIRVRDTADSILQVPSDNNGETMRMEMGRQPFERLEKSTWKVKVSPTRTTHHSVLSNKMARRPNWRKDFEPRSWLPRWSRYDMKDIEKQWQWTQNSDNQVQYYNSTFPLSHEDQAKHDAFFWSEIVASNNNFTFANANIGLGHRLAQLSYSWVCQVVPHRQQQLVHWVTGGLEDNRGWHHLFQDSPVLAGVPRHWKKGKQSLDNINAHRRPQACQDYSTYFPLDCSGMCRGFKHPRDLWFLRFAKEPSAQEFYQLLRAQTQPRIKERVAKYMDDNWPDSSKLVIGVHIRAGNGKDDGLGHFDLVQRGDWLAKDLPKAVTMIRKHIRMVASSILDRYNMGGGSVANVDNSYQVFLATDTEKVLVEFRKQDPSVLSLEQERPANGVAIFQTATCQKASDSVECALQTQENMLIDALLLSSADVLLAESFSNYMYSLPASLALADNKIFCEAGRAALGGRYITQDDRQASLMGDPKWWASPPPNVMPVRCQTSAWAARDRSDLNYFPDVMATT